MGKGDKKTRRGKIHKGTFGVRRPRKNKLNTTQATTKSKITKKKGATKKTATKKT